MIQVRGNHVELRCTFVTGGTAVNVTSPAVEIRENNVSGSSVSIPDSSLLVPFGKDGPTTGRYKVSFLAGDWLANGTYYLAMSGLTDGAPNIQTGSFTARAAGTIQGYIELLRSALHDYNSQLYTVESSSSTLWDDGILYESLNRALNKINYTKPSRYTWTLDTVPWPGLLIDGGVIYAIHSRWVLEIANTFSYSDEISFAIDRSQKYISAIQVFANVWEQNVKSVKTDYAFSMAFPIGMGQTRIPESTSRIFSFMPRVSSFFVGL